MFYEGTEVERKMTRMEMDQTAAEIEDLIRQAEDEEAFWASLFEMEGVSANEDF